MRRTNPCRRKRPARRASSGALTKYIGAEIRGIDLRQKPDEATVRAIYQAWLDHLVLIFPEQKLSQEDLIRATKFFGEPGKLTRPPKYFPKGVPACCPASC